MRDEAGDETAIRGVLSTVVFDLGGVLIDWNPRHLYRKLFARDDAAMEHFLATVCISPTPRCDLRRLEFPSTAGSAVGRAAARARGQAGWRALAGGCYSSPQCPNS
jgi:hypothetical protein